MSSSHVPCRLVSCSATAQQWADLAASLEAHGSLTCLNLTDGELGGPEAPQVPPAAAGGWRECPLLARGASLCLDLGPTGKSCGNTPLARPPQGDNACPTSGPCVPLPSRGRWQARGRPEGRERGQLSPGRALEPLSRRGTRRLENCHLTGACCQELSSALVVNPRLTRLSLAKNDLGDRGVRLLCEGLSYPESRLQPLV